MNRFFTIGMIFLFSLLCLAGVLLFDGNGTGNAQTADSGNQKVPDQVVKSISNEKVERTFAEALKIQTEIVTKLEKKLPEFRLMRTWSRPLNFVGPSEMLGRTHNDMSWEKGKTRLSVDFQLGLNNEEILLAFRNGLERISIGEFFNAPGIGHEARLVKNVESNKRMTNVGLHFVKGRAKVSIYVTNYGRSTAKNEKELMEIVRLIEPLIKARPNFDDL